MAGINLDKHDKQIITKLLEDSSISNLHLSEEIGLAASSCLARVKHLRKEKVITGYTATVDEKKLGIEVTCFAKILMAPFNRESSLRFIEAVNNMPEVVECYTITGDGAFLLKIVAKSFQHYRDFVYDHILTIPNVANIDSSIVVSTEKKTNVIPLE